MGRGNDADCGQPLTCAQGFGGGRELVGHETVEEIPIDPALGRRVGEKVELDPAACLDIGIAPDQKGVFAADYQLAVLVRGNAKDAIETSLDAKIGRAARREKVTKTGKNS